MKKLFAAALLSAVLLTGAMETTPLFAQVSVGIRIGPPPAPRVVHSRPDSLARNSFGLKVTGIQMQMDELTNGTMAIGHGLRSKAPGGFHRTMMASVSSRATGKTAIAAWSTIITGIMTGIVTIIARDPYFV